VRNCERGHCRTRGAKVSVTRAYLCDTLGLEYEVEQRISDPRRTMCDRCSNIHCVPKPLIAINQEALQFRAGPTGGWANTGYAKTESERRAENVLGRKLTKSEK
jgi:predicted nucleic acid-binding Zn ribbon protein